MLSLFGYHEIELFAFEIGLCDFDRQRVTETICAFAPPAYERIVFFVERIEIVVSVADGH